MSNEVQVYEFEVKHGLYREMVLREDYAALESECERWKERCQYNADTAHAVATERDALHTQLEAIRAAGGEQVEVVGFLYEDGDILGKCDMDAGTFSIMASPDFDGNVSKLMTVAQHQRIVVAMAAELEGYRQDTSYDVACETIRKLRAELEAARKQSPIGHVALGSHTGVVFYSHMPQLPDGTKLYALPPLAGQVVVPEWVPVSERLPDHGAPVLVAYKFGGIYTCRRSVIDHDLAADEPMHGERDRPTHWMQLPAAPALLATPSMEVKP